MSATGPASQPIDAIRSVTELEFFRMPAEPGTADLPLFGLAICEIGSYRTASCGDQRDHRARHSMSAAQSTDERLAQRPAAAVERSADGERLSWTSRSARLCRDRSGLPNRPDNPRPGLERDVYQARQRSQQRRCGGGSDIVAVRHQRAQADWSDRSEHLPPRKSAAIVMLKLRGALVTNTSDWLVRQPNLSVILPKAKRRVAGARPIRNL